MFSLDPDNVFRSSVLGEIGWVRHGFGTRLESVWPPRDALTSVRQIHSNTVVVANGGRGIIGEGDALITNESGTLVSVRTADCLPILMADVRNRAVAAVHAGWRGTVSGIVVKTMQALHAEYGSQPEDLRIAIGPGIGPCCFEVGTEVAAQFRGIFPERQDPLATCKLDLAEANRRLFITEGVRPEHIDTATLCTRCFTDLFHSYRRDREQSGRMVSAIGAA